MTFRMFTRLLVAAALLALIGCGKPSDKLIGKWGIDVDQMAELDEFKKMPPEEKKAALEMAKGMVGSMTFEFTKDKVIMEAMGQKREGTYKVQSEEGDKIVLEGTMDGKTEAMQASFKGDTLVLGDGKQQFALKRK